MININVFSNEKAWSKRLKKKELFFNQICKLFPKKYKFQNIKIFEKKLIETFVHGFLHLLGFDHVKNIDYLKMLKEEKKIYQSVISKLN